MKTCLTFAAGLTLVNALITFALFFTGYHSDPEKFATGQKIAGRLGLVIFVAGLILTMRARRLENGAKGYSYGQALVTGILLSVFAAIGAAIVHGIYASVINPGFHDMVYEAQIAAMREHGMSETQIESAGKMLHFFTGLVWTLLMQLIATPLIGTVLSLIISAFMKKAPAVTAEA